MEGLKKALAEFPPELPCILYLYKDNNLLAFTEVSTKQVPYLSPLFYLLLQLTSLAGEDERILKDVKRLIYDQGAYKQHSTPPLVPDALVENLVVYMDNFFDDCPWIFLYETEADYYGKAGTKWPEFQGENCPLITFLDVFTQRLVRKPPFFDITLFEEEDEVSLPSATERDMQKWILDWLKKADADYDDALAEAMEIEPSGESLGSSSNEEDSVDEDDEYSKGKDEM